MSMNLIYTTTGAQSSFGMSTCGHVIFPRTILAAGEWSVRTDVKGHVAAVKATRNGQGTHAWRPPRV
ncbi:hypothetical protein [Nocardioides sp.]|uniref:hypothetical protein n=1 Tax=Nocardioides sp. TaxID=35761 RepID=UPI0039E5EAC4